MMAAATGCRRCRMRVDDASYTIIQYPPPDYTSETFYCKRSITQIDKSESQM